MINYIYVPELSVGEEIRENIAYGVIRDSRH